MDIKKSTAPHYYNYETAPDSPILRGMGISSRQLKRWVELGKLSYVKPGNRVLFSEQNLRDLVERSSVTAVR